MANTIYLLNAFSLQMVDAPCVALFDEVDELPEGLTSAIGHQDTANVLGVPMNRVNIHLSEGDVAYVAQLQGGRLPEGSTTLPEGFSFKFLKVKVVSKSKIEDALYEAYADGNLDGPFCNAERSTVKSILEELFG